MWMAEKGKELDFPDLIDPNRTALIVIDMQNDFCTPAGAYGRAGQDASPMPAVAEKLRRLIEVAREREVFTVFVRASYDEEVTSLALAQNRRRRGLVNSLCLEGTWGAEWYGGVEPMADARNEVVLTKHRFDAFQGTPLDLYLRSNGIRTVVVTGVATSGCVESTVRHAFFQDYMVVVPRDGVAEVGLIYHEQSLAILKRAFVTITHVDDVIAEWKGSPLPVAPPWTAEARKARAAADAEAEGLVLVDIDRLDAAKAAAARTLLATARDRGIPVFDVRTIDVEHGRSPWTSAGPGGRPTELPVKATPAEMQVGKMRRSAFAGTRLGLLLRTNGVRHATIAGADVASGSMVATVLDALDADYAVTVAGDACTGIDLSAAGDAGAMVVPSAEVDARWRARAVRNPSVAAPASAA